MQNAKLRPEFAPPTSVFDILHYSFAPEPAVWWPIRNQILVPFTALLLVAVTLTAVTAAVDAARRSERATVAQLNQVINTLGRSNFPFSQGVLNQMRGLSGAEFAVFDTDGLRVSTLSDALAASIDPAVLRGGSADFTLGESPAIELGGERFFASSVQRTSSGDAATLLVLYPEHSWKQARADAIVPPLVVGGVTLLLTIGVSAWIAHRFSSRIRTVESQVAAIAGGDFQEIPAQSRHDEIQELAVSVNRMSRQLRDQQETIRRTERTRLLGQLAGGLAHQLRNAVTGARLAVQLHRRRLGPHPDSESLDVALRQLSLMEEQVKGLLALGRTERRAPIESSAREIIEETAALVKPACHHAGVVWNCETDAIPDCRLHDAGPIRTALVNLALNAIDAAGSGGEIGLVVTEHDGLASFDISDSGPGPDNAVAESMFDLFVTGKPEGVGIGLAMARQAAEDRGGSLTWSRADNRTHFRLTIPAAQQRVEPAIP